MSLLVHRRTTLLALQHAALLKEHVPPIPPLSLSTPIPRLSTLNPLNDIKNHRMTPTTPTNRGDLTESAAVTAPTIASDSGSSMSLAQSRYPQETASSSSPAPGSVKRIENGLLDVYNAPIDLCEA